MSHDTQGQPEAPAFDLQPTLRGELIELRPLRPDDWAPLFAAASDPLIWEQHPDRERYREDVFRHFFQGALDSGGAFAVVNRQSGRIVGSTRYHGYDEGRREVEIGWTFLVRSHWGGRYNGEMKRLMLDHAFRFVDSVVFLVGPRNVRSQRAVQKLGARLEGPRVARGHESLVFRLEKAAWERRQAASPSHVRVALANLPFPASAGESVALAVEAVGRAAAEGAAVVCFPECYVPGYRAPGKRVAPPGAAFLEQAWAGVASAAAAHRVTVVLGTERIAEDGRPIATALVIEADGKVAGFQDKVQIDPSEEATYSAGNGRRVFQSGGLTFGIVICHEGWRYPETVRWAVRRGAQVVFHQQFHEAEPGSSRPARYADPANTFHEAAVLCRAAENTCYFATVNYASAASPTTSAIAAPDGTLLVHHPYGEAGLLTADLDLGLATGLLANPLRS